MQSDSKEQLGAGRFLALTREGRWEYAERINATGAAIILAVTDDGRVVFVEQFRVPVHARTIELPAGLIGDDPGAGGESDAEAARRELLEETGYAAARMEFVMSGPPSSGTTSEVVSFFRASGLRRMHAGGGVVHENILVHEVPLADVDRWLAAKATAGVLVDPKVYTGLYFLKGGWVME